MISNGTRLPRTGAAEALLRAILSPRDHEFDGWRAVPLNPWGKAVIAMQGGEPIHIGPLRKNVVG